jgi:hypothetical protein
MDADVERALSGELRFLRDVVATVGEGQTGAHAASTNSSMLKLSGRSLRVPWSDGSRWGIEPVYYSLAHAFLESWAYINKE